MPGDCRGEETTREVGGGTSEDSRMKRTLDEATKRGVFGGRRGGKPETVKEGGCRC